MQTKSLLSRISYLTLSAVLALSFLAAALPQSAQAAAPAASCSETYTVKAGETIYHIAKDYSLTVNRLAKTNNLAYPYTLTAGQSLCIPGSSSELKNLSWTATYTNNQVKVEGSGFRKNVPYIVKVRQNDSSAWYKLGQTVSDKNTKIDTTTFKVPKDLQKATELTICLKDGQNDKLYCKHAFRQ